MKKLLGVLLVSMLLFTGCSSTENSNDKPKEENKEQEEQKKSEYQIDSSKLSANDKEKVDKYEKEGWTIDFLDINGYKIMEFSKNHLRFTYVIEDENSYFNEVRFEDTKVSPTTMLGFRYLTREPGVEEQPNYDTYGDVFYIVKADENNEGMQMAQPIYVKSFNNLEVWIDTSKEDMSEELSITTYDELMNKASTLLKENNKIIKDEVKSLNSSLKEVGFKNLEEVKDFLKGISQQLNK